jgi:two-component system, cell cycle response regulator DivK
MASDVEVQTEGKRILVVEDNDDNMNLILDMLQSLRYDSLTAENGETGLQRAREDMPDLILMDLSLPKMNGWTATRHLKADPRTKNIPVIAVTAHAMVGDEERALEAGCDDYISKPIDVRELAHKIRHHLGHSD